jgi:hypothetical protein
MTVRENVHPIIDQLPESRLPEIVDYLNELSDDLPLSAETKAAIGEGLRDIEAGRTVSIETVRPGFSKT